MLREVREGEMEDGRQQNVKEEVEIKEDREGEERRKQRWMTRQRKR